MLFLRTLSRFEQRVDMLCELQECVLGTPIGDCLQTYALGFTPQRRECDRGCRLSHHRLGQRRAGEAHVGESSGPGGPWAVASRLSQARGGEEGLLRGLAAIAEKGGEEALEAYRDLAAVDPAASAGHVLRIAEILNSLGKSAEAAATVDLMLDVFPDRLPATPSELTGRRRRAQFLWRSC